MKNKVVDMEKALDQIKSGMTIMIGGFSGVGGPNIILDEISKMDEIKDLTIIANDTAHIDVGIGKLIVNRQVKKVIASHIGSNRETGNQMNAGELEVELVPQGSLVERVRAGGAGLGGVLTKTGLGTVVEEGKEIIVVDGEDYLLEKPLRADLAIIGGHTVDSFGNIVYKGSTRTYSTVMALAADKVMVEAVNIVDYGEIDPNIVDTSGIFVDYIIKGGAL